MEDAWTAVASWATPTALFILLNVVIGFIAIFASRKTDDPPPPDLHNQFQYHHQQHQLHHRPDSPKTLVRSPSLFSRVTSFDFNFNGHHHYEPSPYESDQSDHGNDAAPPPLARAPSLLSRMSSFSRSFYLHGSVESESNFSPPAPESEAEVASDPSLLARVVNKSAEPESQPPIERTPSLLSRMASFDYSFSRSFYQHGSVESETHYSTPAPATDEKQHHLPPEPESQPPIERTPSLLSRIGSFDFSFHRSAKAGPELVAREEHARVARSVTEPARKPPAGGKMKKSTSEKAETASFAHHDDEVDAKADDFINRFKQQLRLQRLDSLLRYRSSGAGS